jgi:hypothetical protein
MQEPISGKTTVSYQKTERCQYEAKYEIKLGFLGYNMDSDRSKRPTYEAQ